MFCEQRIARMLYMPRVLMTPYPCMVLAFRKYLEAQEHIQFELNDCFSVSKVITRCWCSLQSLLSLIDCLPLVLFMACSLARSSLLVTINPPPLLSLPQ